MTNPTPRQQQALIQASIQRGEMYWNRSDATLMQIKDTAMPSKRECAPFSVQESMGGGKNHMEIIREYMSADHHRCDDLFATAEESAGNGAWEKIVSESGVFLESMRHHFAMEEDVLFPAIEGRTGMRMGPTQIMRMEHNQMRELFEALSQAIESRDQNDYLGQAETLLVLMQQHNLKEEQILYRMADEVLASEAAQIIDRLKAVA